MSNVPFTMTTDPTTGNIIAGFGGIALGGNTIADWPNGALCSTFPPGGAGWPPGTDSDGPANNPAVILDFLNAVIWDGTGGPVMDIPNRLLNNGSGACLDFANRLLLDDDGDTTMDWSSQAAARASLAFNSVVFADYTDSSNSGTSPTQIWSYSFGDVGSPWDQQGATIGFTMVLALANSGNTKEVQIALAGTTIYDTGALTVGTASQLVIRGEIWRASIGLHGEFRCTVTATASGISLGAAQLAQYTSFTWPPSLPGGALTLVVTATSAGMGAGTGDITGQATRVMLAPPPVDY